VIDAELYVNYEPLNTDIDHLNRRFGSAAVYNNPLWSGLQGVALYGGKLFVPGGTEG